MIPALMAALRGAGAAGAGAAASGGGAAAAATSGQKLSGVLQQLTQRGNQASNALGHIPGQLNQISSHFVSTLATASNAIRAMAAPMESFVALSNPAAIKQFTLAMNDMNAVFGSLLLPVFESLTRAARTMGDTYATLESSIRPAMLGIASMFDSVFTALGSVARDNAFAITAMANAIGTAATVMGQMAAFAIKLGSALNPVMRMFRGVADLLGVGPPDEKSARGRAVRSVSIGSSGEDVARKAQEAAFSAGLNKPQDPVVSELSLIKGILETIKTTIDLFPTWEQLKGALPGGPTAGPGAAAGAALPAGSGFNAGRALASLITR